LSTKPNLPEHHHVILWFVIMITSTSAVLPCYFQWIQEMLSHYQWNNASGSLKDFV